jgi:hypothetical protein
MLPKNFFKVSLILVGVLNANNGTTISALYVRVPTTVKVLFRTANNNSNNFFCNVGQRLKYDFGSRVFPLP